MTCDVVALTGLGAVTPVGNDAEATVGGAEGRAGSGVGPITTVRRRDFPVQIAGHGHRTSTSPSACPTRRLAREHLSRAAGFGVGGGAGGARRRRARRAPTSRTRPASRSPAASAGRTCRSSSTCRARSRSRRARPLPPGARRRAASATRTSRRRRSARSANCRGADVRASAPPAPASRARARRGLPARPGGRREGDDRRRLRRADDLVRRDRLRPARRADQGPRRRARAGVAAVRQGALGLRARRGRGDAVLEDSSPRRRAARGSTARSSATAPG